MGKTTFIRHLLGCDYPGINIGPEPTTGAKYIVSPCFVCDFIIVIDKYIAVVNGKENKIIKGNSLTAVDELPYAGLSTFGTGFLNKFEAAVVDSPILRLFIY